MRNQALCELIGDRITASPQRQITFAEYMDLALYHPQHGYYTGGAGKIGGPGDFVTSSHLCSDFGELLAEQFVQMWEIMGKPAPFQLVEMGAGQGLVAGDLLTYLQKKYIDFFNILEYVIVEKSVGMRAFQQRQLKKWTGSHLRWCSWEEIPPQSITGCCFSNELVDAFPVHQFVIDHGKLKEIYVTISNDGFAEVLGELSTPKLAEYFDLVGIKFQENNYPNGYRSEINLGALDWLSGVGDRLKRGYLLTIDYGYSAERYYHPNRYQGTLQCYYQHRYHDNPYVNVGEQDITAHVNFTALERQGELCELDQVGFIQQGLFLMALGLGDRLGTLSSTSGIDIATLLHRREVLHGLIDPMGLGGFSVLVQGKGLNEEEKKQILKGLSMPPMRGYNLRKNSD